MTEGTQPTSSRARSSTSEVNLQITITHEWNLHADATQIADRVAVDLAKWLTLGDGEIVTINDRIRESGPVRVFLRSAFMTKVS